MAFVIRLRRWQRVLLLMTQVVSLRLKKIRFGKRLRLLIQILPLQRILNLIPFHHLVWWPLPIKITLQMMWPCLWNGSQLLLWRRAYWRRPILKHLWQWRGLSQGLLLSCTIMMMKSDQQWRMHLDKSVWRQPFLYKLAVWRLKHGSCMVIMQFILMQVILWQWQMPHALKWRLSWPLMVSNRNQPLLKVVERTTLFMRVTMRLWPLQLGMTVANWKKWKSLHEQTWTTMPWTGISLVAASMEQVILLLSREILRLPVPTQLSFLQPFIWRMIWPILPVTHGSVMLLLLIMRLIWTVQMVWVKFGLPKDVLLIVRRVWRRQTLFRWRV